MGRVIQCLLKSRSELAGNDNSKYDLDLHAAGYSMQCEFNSFILPVILNPVEVSRVYGLHPFYTRIKFLLITLNVDNASM